MRRLACVLVFCACQAPGSGTDGGLVVISDTAQMGPPPACNAETPTTGDDSTGDASTGGSAGEAVEADGRPLSRGPGASRAQDPGTAFCGAFDTHAACEGTLRMDGDAVVGECRWISVVPVIPGTCEANQLYSTCVHVPHGAGGCEAAMSCGQVGLGVYGRMGCDGNVEVIVVPPGQALCHAPTDWPLCWPDDTAPECTCICS
jgi:hypothetical protein